MVSEEGSTVELSTLEFPSDPTASDDGSVDDEFPAEIYERLMLKGKCYLCAIPRVEALIGNDTQATISEADQEKELARASDSGWQLLHGMEGGPCLYFRSGWWSYAFCYNSQVRQFHALDPGNSVPIWPPTEDPTTPSYVLGKVVKRSGGVNHDHSSANHGTEVAELQTKTETRYLVQKLGGGTTCDLTGKDRKVEVQFYCSQQSSDRIGWIKEVTTCTYLMVVYTPRLCNDVAFLPPKAAKSHVIACRQILKPDEVPDWESRKILQTSQKLLDQTTSTPRPMYAGNIEIGGMKEVGRDGRRIEKGKVVSTAHERVETVVMQKDGQVQQLSKAELKKLDLNPSAIEAFRKELEELAGSKDWKIELIDDDNGNAQLRGVLSNDEQGDKKNDEGQRDEEEEGSQEEYKEDI